MLRYYKLFDLLNRRGMKKTDLLEIMSTPTLAKLSKGQPINTNVIERICEFLNCQPSDIMEYIPNDSDKRDELTFSEIYKQMQQEIKDAPTERDAIEAIGKAIKNNYEREVKNK